MKHILTFLFISFVCQSAYSTYVDKRSFKYGLFYNAATVSVKATVSDFSAVSTYPKGSYNVWSIGDYYGLFAMVPVCNDDSFALFDIGLRVAFLNNVSNFYPDTYDMDEHSKVILPIKNTFEWLSITPIIRYPIYGELNATAGLQLNFPLISEGIFDNAARNVHLYPKNNIDFRLQFGLSYPICIGGANSPISFIPEVNLMLGLNNDIGSGYDGYWKSNYFGVGAALQYSRWSKFHPYKEIDYQYKPLEVDTITRIAKYGDGYFKYGNVKEDSTIVNVDDEEQIITYAYSRTDTIYLKSRTFFELEANTYVKCLNGDTYLLNDSVAVEAVETYAYSETFPLLPHIFFEQGSAAIPERYSQQKLTFLSNGNPDTKEIDTSTYSIDSYYQILNIVGSRLQEHPDWILTLHGCNDGWTKEEKDNLTLSTARAAAIKTYLLGTFNVNVGQIVVESQNLPDKPSLKISEPIKMEENRRVDFFANNDSLLMPVARKGRMLESNIVAFNVVANVYSTSEIKRYRLLLKFADSVIQNISVEYPPYKNGYLEINETVELANNIVNASNNYEITLIITDANNAVREYSKQIPVNYSSAEQRLANNLPSQIYDNYLILFDLKNSELNEYDMMLLKKIDSGLTNSTNVYIVGYTDVSGRDEFNTKLALERAENVRMLFKRSNANVSYSDDINSTYFNNKFPEGRFYSRSVEISTIRKDDVYFNEEDPQ